MAAAVSPAEGKVSSSTLLELQLRRRQRRSKHFLLKHTTIEAESLEEPLQAATQWRQRAPEARPVEAEVPREPLTEDEVALQLAGWIKQMANFESIDLSLNDTSGMYTMPSAVSKDAASIDPYPNLEKEKFTYKGGRDKDRRFHGRGEVEFENDCSMAGVWKNGKREGKCRMDAMEGQVSLLEGYFSNDKINGKVRVQLNDGSWITGYAKESVLHGFCRYYDKDKKLQYMGITRNGKLFGTCWKILPGGGYMVGKVDAEGEFTGPNIAYIYPDNCTAFLGMFEKGDMVRTQAVTLRGFDTEYNCIKVPIFSKPYGEFFKKEVSTTDWLTPNTMLEDPYEVRTVYVGVSKTPGAEEGLFAARDLKLNTIAAFYNGIRRQKPADSTSTWQLQANAYKIFDPTNKHGVIDILPEYQSLERYRASLAHKTNHSFLPNCEFAEVLHPRWGFVPCVMTREDVKRGDELTVWYGYDLDYCPDWYKDAWETSCVSSGDSDKLKSG